MEETVSLKSESEEEARTRRDALLPPLAVLHVLPNVCTRDGENESVRGGKKEVDEGPEKHKRRSVSTCERTGAGGGDGTHFSSSPSRSLSLTAFSFQNCSDSCGGDQVRCPDSSSEVYSSQVLRKTKNTERVSVRSLPLLPPSRSCQAHESPSAFSFSASTQIPRSSTTSSSPHFLP